MRANPGGFIPPSEVIGRDALCQRLWRVLERQSLVLCAERRIGKTCIIKKMQAEVGSERLAVYRDVEGLKTPLEFAEAVFSDVEMYLSNLKRTSERTRKWLTQMTGMEVGGLIKVPAVVAPHWKTLLTRTLEDLIEHQERPVIFFWDELPLMLHEIKRSAGEDAACELLDALRNLRQHLPIRMVFTGSIGLHNVITRLKRRGYANDPTNDMHTEDVPPLAVDAAKNLALQLLNGEDIAADDPPAVASRIAEEVDRVPYYIHHVVDHLAQLVLENPGRAVSAQMVTEIVTDNLTDPQDRWHLYYYLERLSTYYVAEEQKIARAILDVLASRNEALPFSKLLDEVKLQIATEDEEQLRQVLLLLQRDHYVRQQHDGTFGFQFPLIQRWWRTHRGPCR